MSLGMKQHVQSCYRQDNKGNLSISTAIVGVMLVSAIGASIDGARMVTTKHKLKSISDAAALMAMMPEKVSASERVRLAKSSVKTHSAVAGSGLKLNEPQIQVRDADGQVQVSLSAETSSLFGAFVGKDSLRVSASSTAEEGFGGGLSSMSLSVVLDLSSSMGDRFDRGSKIASVNAAVSDMFNMINAEFGGEAAAATRVSTGLYPFNWGAVDGETVSLRPGTGDVLNSLSYLSLGDGSVPGDALEEALEDQIKDAKLHANRDRFLIYMSDGKVDEDRDDVPSRYLREPEMFAVKDSKQCLKLAENLLKMDMEINPSTASVPGNGSLLSPVLGIVGGLLGAGGSTEKTNPGLAEKRIVLRRNYMRKCEPTQAIRVSEICEKARAEDVRVIGINLSGEHGVATNAVEMCTHGLVEDKKKGGKNAAAADHPAPPTTQRGLPSGLKVNVSADGKSFSGTPTNLAELREMLNSVLPDGDSQRTVRLIN